MRDKLKRRWGVERGRPGQAFNQNGTTIRDNDMAWQSGGVDDRIAAYIVASCTKPTTTTISIFTLFMLNLRPILDFSIIARRVRSRALSTRPRDCEQTNLSGNLPHSRKPASERAPNKMRLIHFCRSYTAPEIQFTWRGSPLMGWPQPPLHRARTRSSPPSRNARCRIPL